MRMLKKHWKILLALCLAVITIAVGTVVYYARQTELLNTEAIAEHKKPYKVDMGMNARIIAEELTKGAYPRFIINLYLRDHPELTAVQKGRYRIDGKKTLPEILKDMVQGKIAEEDYLQLGIVEGSNLSALYGSLKKLFPAQYDEMYKILSDPADFIIESLKNDVKLLEAVGGAGHSLEGLLMPATYPVYHKDRPLGAVASALRSTARFMAAQWPDRDQSAWVKTPYEALIIASIIERETLVDDERPYVAAVFYNRLKKNMRLQTDPTVMYGISPDFSGRLSREQLRKDTPYNTYTRGGLPPTPIAMPSKASIEAALHPADSKALYFVAADVSPTKGHVFTNSLDDHNKAVAQYRRKVREYKKNLKNAGPADKIVDGDDNFRDLGSADKPSSDKNKATAKNADNKAGAAAKKGAELRDTSPSALKAQNTKSDQDKSEQNGVKKEGAAASQGQQQGSKQGVKNNGTSQQAAVTKSANGDTVIDVSEKNTKGDMRSEQVASAQADAPKSSSLSASQRTKK